MYKIIKVLGVLIILILVPVKFKVAAGSMTDVSISYQNEPGRSF